MPRGSVIIVTHNSGQCIEPCLQSVSGQEGWEVLVVDNASQDDTVARVRKFERVRLLPNSRNTGFAAAVNQGMRAASGSILLVLNPDTRAERESLDRLADSLETASAGAAGGALLRPDGKIDAGFAVRRFPTVAAMLTEMFLLNRVWPANPWNRHYRALDLDYSLQQEVDQPAGACLAIRREAWENIGGFDEQFFPVWFEDVDFCRRLHLRGWAVWYCPTARFLHAGGHSVQQVRFRDRQQYWYRNLLRYFRKHHGRPVVLLLRAGIVAGLSLRSLLCLLGQGPGGVSAREALAGYAKVIWKHGFRGGEDKRTSEFPGAGSTLP